MARPPRKVAPRSVDRPSRERASRSSAAGPASSFLEQARIFDISQDAIFLWQNPGGIQFWNKGAIDLYGYSEKQALGKVSHQLLKTKFPVSPPELISLLRQKGSWEGELRQQTRDRREVIVSARLQLLPNSDRKLLVLESTRDLTEMKRKQAELEQHLREAAARLKGIVETAVDGIITISDRGIVETMNPAAEKIFGYRASEVIGNNVSMLMPEPYRTQHDAYLNRYRHTGEARIIGIGREVRGQRKDGTEFPLDLAVSENDLGSRKIFTGLLRDITARKRLEEEIIEISEHEQRRIGSDLHDDLCQQLAGIRFGCDILKKKLATTLENKEILERVDKLADELTRAIDHTRILARGMAPVALEKNGLASALHELTQSLRKLFAVDCTFEAKSNVAIDDVIAATHLYRIAQEAMTNALKHGQATRIRVSLERAGDEAILRITDNGRGFSQVTANKAQGMGLRTIRYRAGMIGAYLQIESRLNRGTTISCTFRDTL
jgi:PAS domain S-box-containing protein